MLLVIQLILAFCLVSESTLAATGALQLQARAQPSASQNWRRLAEQMGRQVTSITLWQPPPPAVGDLAVRQVRDLAYVDGPAAEPIRHRLDLFVPRDKKSFPVVVLVHGGAWVTGDNRCCGLYSSVGHFLASQGIGVVLPNYRLSPAVVHPEHARDVARAVRWTHDHIAEYGGDPERLFLMGHSAGGHLVALLGTDESYLKREKLSHKNIKGVIGVSGVYALPPGPMETPLGGDERAAFHPEQMLPIRDVAGGWPKLPFLGVRVKVDLFSAPFGDDPKQRRDASPLEHVRRGLPPFLLLAGDRDLPTLADMAGDFHKALLRQGCSTRLVTLQERNHNTTLFSIVRRDDPAAQAVLEFVLRDGKAKR